MTQKLKQQTREIRTQISLPEYLFWWIVRIFLLMYIIKQFGEEHKWIDYLLPVLIGLGTVGVLLIRMIFPKKSMFSRISFHLQTYVSLLCLTGSIGNYFGLYSTNGTLHYDWMLHVVSGLPITMIGYYLLVAMNNDKTKLTPEISACGGMGFSFIVIIAWEIMEFCGDFLFGDNNQKYNWVIVEDDPFYPLFSRAAPGAAQAPLDDTIVDMATAFFTTIITGVVLYVVLKHKERKQERRCSVDQWSTAAPQEARTQEDKMPEMAV